MQGTQEFAEEGQGASSRGRESYGALLEGEVIGQYKVVARFEQSECGETYLVRHSEEETLYILRMLNHSVLREPEHRATFDDLLSRLRHLDHPNILRLVASNVAEEPFYIVSDFAGVGDSEEFYDLEACLDDCGGLDTGAIRHVVLQVCAGVEYAHQQGVVHGRLVPSSVFLSSHDPENAQAFIYGFAESYLPHPAEEMEGSKPLRLHPGSKELSSLCGAGRSRLDDVRALGAMLYGMLLGEPTQLQAMPKDLGAAHEASPIFAEVIARCVSDDPSERFNTVSEVAEAVRDPKAILLSGRKKGRTDGRTPAWYSLRSPSIATALVLILLSLTGATWYLLQGWRNNDREIERVPSRASPDRIEEWEQVKNAAENGESAADEQRRKRVVELLTSSREAMLDREYAKASEGVERALELDAENAEALSLEARIDKRMGVVDLAPVRGKAKQRWQLASKMDRGVGLGFGPRLDAAEALFHAAETLFQKNHYRRAREQYAEVVDRCEALLILDEKRSAYLDAREAASAARSQAEAAGAEAWARELWQQAVTTAQKAVETGVPNLPDDYHKESRSEVENRFAAAVDSWKGVAEAFQATARKALQTACAEAEYAKDRERWDEVLAVTRDLLKQRAESLAGLRPFYARLERVEQEALQPRVRITAALGEREIPGALIYRGSTKGEATAQAPATLSLTKGKPHRIVVDHQIDHRFYSGVVVGKADHSGVRDVRVELREGIGGDPAATSWQRHGLRWILNKYDEGRVTVTDRKTRLMWLYKTDTLEPAGWFSSYEACMRLEYAGHSDWFLPERVQLETFFAGRPRLWKDEEYVCWSSTKYYRKGVYKGVYAVHSGDGQTRVYKEEREHLPLACRRVDE